MYDLKYLQQLEDKIRSGAMEMDFEMGSQSKKHEMLEFMERFMDVAELVDEAATRLIFKDSSLAIMAGVKSQK